MADVLSPEELAVLLKRAGKWLDGVPREQVLAVEWAGLISLQAWGQSLALAEAIDPIDGEPAPKTMDEAFALLRRLVDRDNLSPMGVLHAFTAGNLAGRVMGDAFPALLAHRVEGQAASFAAQEATHG